MPTVTPTLEGLRVIENRKFSDDRGFFLEYFNEQKLAADGLDLKFVQANHSRSRSGVVRGLHFQPRQGKLVGVIRGRIWDVAVDIRRESPTFGRHFGLELSDENNRLLWIPSGFAHGFCVIGDQPADVLYLVTDFYNPKAEAGILWNDPDLTIPWPLNPTQAIVSDRDAKQPPLALYFRK